MADDRGLYALVSDRLCPGRRAEAEAPPINAMIDYLNAQTILDQQVGTTLDTWQISLDD